MSAPGVQFVAAGSYLPERVVTNAEFVLDGRSDFEDDEFFKGVRQRRWAGSDETSVSMAARACRDLFERSGRRPADVDLVIASSLISDAVLPQIACGVQWEVGASKASAITLETGCASFVSGVIHGAALIRAGFHRSVLVVSVANFAGRSQGRLANRAAMIPGDGAGAVLLESSDHGDGLLGWSEQSFGQFHGLMTVDPMPVNGEIRRHWEPHDKIAFQFNQKLIATVKANGLIMVPQAIRGALRSASLSVSDAQWILTHQPNRFLIDHWRADLGADPHQCHDTLEIHGNLFQASIPVALASGLEQGRIRPGHVVAAGAFAFAGEMAAAVVMRWGELR